MSARAKKGSKAKRKATEQDESGASKHAAPQGKTLALVSTHVLPCPFGWMLGIVGARGNVLAHAARGGEATVWRLQDAGHGWQLVAQSQYDFAAINDRFVLLFGEPASLYDADTNTLVALREDLFSPGGWSVSGNLILMRDLQGIQTVFAVQTEPTLDLVRVKVLEAVRNAQLCLGGACYVAFEPKQVAVADLASDSVKHTIKNPAWRDFSWNIGFGPDSDDLFTVTRDNIASACRASTGECLCTIKAQPRDYARLTAAGHMMTSYRLVDCTSGALVAESQHELLDQDHSGAIVGKDPERGLFVALPLGDGSGFSAELALGHPDGHVRCFRKNVLVVQEDTELHVFRIE